MAENFNESEIRRILDMVFSNGKFPLKDGPEYEIYRGMLEFGLLKQLQEGKINPNKIEEFINELIYRFRRSQVDPGTPSGSVSALGLGRSGTQGSLNSFHNTGRDTNNGFSRTQELLTASENSKNPTSIIVFAERMTFEEVLENQSDFVKVSISSVLKNHEVIERPTEKPEWLDIFLEIYDMGEELPPTPWVLELEFDLNELYLTKVTLEDIYKVILEDQPLSVFPIFSPYDDGKMWIYPIQEMVEESFQNNINKLLKQQEKKKMAPQLQSIVSVPNQIKAFINNELIPKLGTLRIKGMEGIKRLFPEELPLYPTENKSNRFTKISTVFGQEGPKFKLEFELNRMFEFGIFIRDIEDTMQLISDKNNGIYNFNSDGRNQIFRIAPWKDNNFYTNLFDLKSREAFQIISDPEFTEFEVDVDILMYSGYDPMFVLTTVLAAGGRLLKYTPPYLLFDNNLSGIAKYIKDLKSLVRQQKINGQEPDESENIVRQAIFVYAVALGSNIDGIYNNPELINPEKSRTDNPRQIYHIYGIEGARTFLNREVFAVQQNTGTNLDPRHFNLLIDSMTFSGQIIGVTFTQLSSQRIEPFGTAAFERSLQTLQRAAPYGLSETTGTVAGSILTGGGPRFGTGIVEMSFDMEKLRTSIAQNSGDSVSATPINGDTPVVPVVVRRRNLAQKVTLKNRTDEPISIGTELATQISDGLINSVENAPTIACRIEPEPTVTVTTSNPPITAATSSPSITIPKPSVTRTRRPQITIKK